MKMAVEVSSQTWLRLASFVKQHGHIHLEMRMNERDVGHMISRAVQGITRKKLKYWQQLCGYMKGDEVGEDPIASHTASYHTGEKFRSPVRDLQRIYQ